MKILKTKEQTVNVLVDIICNKCNKTCMRDFVLDRMFYGESLIYWPGYLSTEFEDDNKGYLIHICEKCIFELFSGCKIPPEILPPTPK